MTLTRFGDVINTPDTRYILVLLSLELVIFAFVPASAYALNHYSSLIAPVGAPSDAVRNVNKFFPIVSKRLFCVRNNGVGSRFIEVCFSFCG